MTAGKDMPVITTVIGDDQALVSEFTDIGLAPDTPYHYQVDAE